MALELEGKPYKLTSEELKKYSTKMVFRVGSQYIRLNTFDPELKPVEVAPVHVLAEYQHHQLDNGNPARLGKLVYFESKIHNAENKRDEYSPARIAIGYEGYIQSSEAELNFFLDNHPGNEVVKANPLHPNHKSSKETYFATYQKDKNRNQLQERLLAISELTQLFFNKQKMSHTELKAIATLVVRSANDYRMAHKLFNIDEDTADDLRVELARLSAMFPIEMNKIVNSKQIDHIKEVDRFKEIGLIRIVNEDWVESDGTNIAKVIMRIPKNADADKALAEWFKKYDRKGDTLKSLQTKAEVIELAMEKA